MRLLFLLFLITAVQSAKDFPALTRLKSRTSLKQQENAVAELVKRTLPKLAETFDVSIREHDGNDFFNIFKSGSKVKIEAGSGVAAASGFNYYLKYYLKGQVAWQVDQLRYLAEQPDLEVNETKIFNDRFRYYQNVCTSGYSFVWWDWPKWEKHIDWMAMNSFNLVLSFGGQEAIWLKIYEKLGLSVEEIDFSGPAFLPWARMGNIRGFAGGLSPAWHARSLNLQKLILARMREFGMFGVLPAFAGIVPKAFDRLYPNVTLYKLPKWNNFDDSYTSPYLLDPTDPIFNFIGRLFLKEIIDTFGTDHLYNCDTYNEMQPPKSDVEYLKASGAAVYQAMLDIDDQAIWLMQGWLFASDPLFWTRKRSRALLTSIPQGKMIVLDLQSEQYPQYDRLDSYFGQPYIWCMLHNFGGTLSMFGSTKIINERIFDARNSIDSTLIGTGITPEGINQNYVIYDLMTEMSWRKGPVNLTLWFRDYAERRYGGGNRNIFEAWEILQGTVYNFDDVLYKQRGKFVYNRSPRSNIQIYSWYDRCQVTTAWIKFVTASKAIKSEGFKHDLVDLTRQVLQNFADQIYPVIIEAFKTGNLTLFNDSSRLFLEIFDDAEEILASNGNFLLGTWLSDAKRCASNSDDAKLFEYNARNQITLWGPKGEIVDYANKQWAGMFSSVFRPRWKRFLGEMWAAMSSGKKFNERRVRRKIFKAIEKPFTYDRSEFPEKSTGDSVEIALKLRTKWIPRSKC